MKRKLVGGILLAVLLPSVSVMGTEPTKERTQPLEISEEIYEVDYEIEDEEETVAVPDTSDEQASVKSREEHELFLEKFLARSSGRKTKKGDRRPEEFGQRRDFVNRRS